MILSELKKVVRTGDVVSFRGTGFLAWLVRWWTKSDVAHIGFALWLRFGKDTEDRICLLHSHPFGGIHITPLEGSFVWQASKVNGDEAVGYALEQWGRHYASLWQFLLIGFPNLRARWESFGGEVGQDGRYHCSQLVSEALSFTGVTLPKGAAEMTPEDVKLLSCLEAPVNVD